MKLRVNVFAVKYVALKIIRTRLVLQVAFVTQKEIYIYKKVAKCMCYTIYNSRTAVPILMIFIFLDSSEAPTTE